MLLGGNYQSSISLVWCIINRLMPKVWGKLGFLIVKFNKTLNCTKYGLK